MLRRPVARRRGVGLLGTMAVGGAAYAAGSSMARRSAADQDRDARLAELEAQQYAPPQQQYAAPPQQFASSPGPGGITPEKIEQLKQLGALKEQGILTAEEFESQKQRLLA
jgi:Short C-terminal domain